MTLYRSTKLFTGLYLLFILSACGIVDSGSSNIDEGYIEFQIDYLDDEKENPVISLLPSKMTMKFKQNSTIAKIEGFFGVFSMSYITDAEKGLNLTLLKIMDKKYIYEIDTTGEAVGYESMIGLQVKKTDKTKMVAGYLCHEAEIICPEGRNNFFVYYTYDIDIQEPNRYNPFNEIDGVLLEFQSNLNNINMKFTAQKVVDIEVEDKTFYIPKGYKKVTKNEMRQIVESFNSTAN